jgi:hypothetical protein
MILHQLMFEIFIRVCSVPVRYGTVLSYLCVFDCLLHITGTFLQVALDAIQILGGNGYINDYPTGRYLRYEKSVPIRSSTIYIN